MKVKVLYSWEMGVSDTLIDFNELNNWMSANRNLKVLSITEYLGNGENKEAFVKPTEEQMKQIDSAYQAQWEELSKYCPSEPMPDESMTEWDQGKAILNTEEEKDESLTSSIIIACVLISIACFKYIVFR